MVAASKGTCTPWILVFPFLLLETFAKNYITIDSTAANLGSNSGSLQNSFQLKALILSVIPRKLLHQNWFPSFQYNLSTSVSKISHYWLNSKSFPIFFPSTLSFLLGAISINKNFTKTNTPNFTQTQPNHNNYKFQSNNLILNKCQNTTLPKCKQSNPQSQKTSKINLP